MFSVLTECLAENGKGIRAYRICAERGYRAAEENTDAAAAFFLLARSAEMFVDMNERMPITSADVEAAFTQFKADAETLDAAWATPSAQDRIEALNAVTQSLMTRAG